MEGFSPQGKAGQVPCCLSGTQAAQRGSHGQRYPTSGQAPPLHAAGPGWGPWRVSTGPTVQVRGPGLQPDPPTQVKGSLAYHR